MTLIQWNENLRVNVVEIDRQHQRLIGMINDLHAAMIQHKSKDILGKVVDELVVYAGTHFSTEEKYFERFAYPDAGSHKREHSDFTRKAAEFKAGYAAGELGLSVDVLQFLSSWLCDHIAGADKKYGPFFNEKGLR